MWRHHCCCFTAANKAGGANLPGDGLLCALCSWYVFCTLKYIFLKLENSSSLLAEIMLYINLPSKQSNLSGYEAVALLT